MTIHNFIINTINEGGVILAYTFGHKTKHVKRLDRVSFDGVLRIDGQDVT